MIDNINRIISKIPLLKMGFDKIFYLYTFYLNVLYFTYLGRQMIPLSFYFYFLYNILTALYSTVLHSFNSIP